MYIMYTHVHVHGVVVLNLSALECIHDIVVHSLPKKSSRRGVGIAVDVPVLSPE